MPESCQNEDGDDCDGTLSTTRVLCMNERTQIDTKKGERRLDRVCVGERVREKKRGDRDFANGSGAALGRVAPY